MELKEFIRDAMGGLHAMAGDPKWPRSMVDQAADAILVDFASRAMSEKLGQARRAGRGGWWNRTECSIDELRRMLRERVDKGDMRDVMNLAAMIFTREIADGPAEAAAPRA